MAADEQGREELHDEAPIEDVEGHKRELARRGLRRGDRGRRGAQARAGTRGLPEETDDVEGHKRELAPRGLRRGDRRRRKGHKTPTTRHVEDIDSDDDDDVEGHKNRSG